MEPKDRLQIERVVPTNSQLRRLYEEHQSFHKKLDRLEKRQFLTSNEEFEFRQLKKKKLRGVDQMMAILSQVQASSA